MKDALKDDNRYKRFKGIVSKYNNDEAYEAFRDELFKIFNEPKFVFSLKGCIILFKNEHKPNFKIDCEQFIKS